MAENPSDKHFDQYTAIQQYKHDLLGYYLGGWFPKIASLGGQFVYCETHAGKGIYKGGKAGSPVIAVQALLSHAKKDLILTRGRAVFFLMEIEEEYAEELRSQLSGVQHQGIRIDVVTGDFKEVLSRALDDLEAQGKRMAPALTFVDPFGYDLPLDLIQRLLRQTSGEVLVTFMAQAVARAVGDATKAGNLDRLYGGAAWRAMDGVEDFEQRKLLAIDLYRKAVGSRWCTPLRLTGRTDYALMHFTKHREGRRLMKQAAWSTARGGSYQVFGTDNPNQLLLIETEPDLSPLAQALRLAFPEREVRHPQLVEWMLDTDYLDKHLNQVLTAGKEAGWIETEHKGRFGPSVTAPIRIRRA